MERGTKGRKEIAFFWGGGRLVGVSCWRLSEFVVFGDGRLRNDLFFVSAMRGMEACGEAAC